MLNDFFKQNADQNNPEKNNPDQHAMSYPKDSKLGKGIERIIAEVPGLIAVAVVDIASGMAIASHSLRNDFNPDVAAAYNAEVVKSKLNAVKALGLSEGIDDVLITLETQIHLMKVIADNKFFIYIAADVKSANLAIVRVILRKYAADIASLASY
jgi:hypothetical protein